MNLSIIIVHWAIIAVIVLFFKLKRYLYIEAANKLGNTSSYYFKLKNKVEKYNNYNLEILTFKISFIINIIYIILFPMYGYQEVVRIFNSDNVIIVIIIMIILSIHLVISLIMMSVSLSEDGWIRPLMYDIFVKINFILNKPKTKIKDFIINLIIKKEVKIEDNNKTEKLNTKKQKDTRN